VVNENIILDELSSLDPDRITPLEAISLINKWKQQFKSEQKKNSVTIDVLQPRSRGNKQNDPTPSLFDIVL
jgi:hypothetical protein